MFWVMADRAIRAIGVYLARVPALLIGNLWPSQSASQPARRAAAVAAAAARATAATAVDDTEDERESECVCVLLPGTVPKRVIWS